MEKIATFYLIFGLKVKNRDEFISEEKYYEYVNGIISRLYGYDVHKGTCYQEDLLEEWWERSNYGEKIPGTPYCVLEVLNKDMDTVDIFIALRYDDQDIYRNGCVKFNKEINLPTQEEIFTFIAFISSKGIGINGQSMGYPVSKYSQWISIATY